MVDLLAHLKNVRRSGEGWTAVCPGHDDHTASLSIGCGADGRWLIKCHAGCDPDAIVAAVNLEPRDLFRRNGDGTSRRMVAVYDYLNTHTKTDLVQLAKTAPLFQKTVPRVADEATPPGKTTTAVKQGHAVLLEDPEPWPEPVDGVALLDAIAGVFSRYLAMPPHASTALALWFVHAYAFDAWFASPFLAITSPTKRCGKTLLLIILGALISRRLFAANVTPAVLFRAIEKYRPVLLIDEADSFIRNSDELRGVLNSGHTRTTAVVIRAVGDDHDPRAFSTWCPKAIALIGKLPDTLADRAIEVPMRRRTAGETVERLRQDRIEAECADWRRQAVRRALAHPCARGRAGTLR